MLESRGKRQAGLWLEGGLGSLLGGSWSSGGLCAHGYLFLLIRRGGRDELGAELVFPDVGRATQLLFLVTGRGQVSSQDIVLAVKGVSAEHLRSQSSGD